MFGRSWPRALTHQEASATTALHAEAAGRKNCGKMATSDPKATFTQMLLNYALKRVLSFAHV